MLALGYSGWAPGQLENEIQRNGWLHCAADEELLFGMAHEAQIHPGAAQDRCRSGDAVRRRRPRLKAGSLFFFLRLRGLAPASSAVLPSAAARWVIGRMPLRRRSMAVRRLGFGLLDIGLVGGIGFGDAGRPSRRAMRAPHRDRGLARSHSQVMAVRPLDEA